MLLDFVDFLSCFHLVSHKLFVLLISSKLLEPFVLRYIWHLCGIYLRLERMLLPKRVFSCSLDLLSFVLGGRLAQSVSRFEVLRDCRGVKLPLNM